MAMLRMPLPLGCLGLVVLFALLAVPGRAADSTAPAAAQTVEPAALLGLTRADVIALRGKPTGERQRGDLLVMVYADGTRIELRNDQVVAVNGASGGAGQIVGADGTRYVPGADGNIQRPVEISDPAASAAAEPAPQPGTGPAPTSVTESDGDLEEAFAGADGAGDPELMPSEAIRAIEQHLEQAEQAAEAGPEEPARLPPALHVAATLFGAAFRFGLIVVVLRAALHVMGVPFYWPDLLKVSLLYLAVRETLAALGELGGWWEFIPLFRLQEVISFLVLACSLTWFKIAGSGITALRIAVAAKVVVYVLMLIVAFLITLALSALR